MNNIAATLINESINVIKKEYEESPNKDRTWGGSCLEGAKNLLKAAQEFDELEYQGVIDALTEAAETTRDGLAFAIRHHANEERFETVVLAKVTGLISAAIEAHKLF